VAYIEPDFQRFMMVAVFSDGEVDVSNLLKINKVRVASHGKTQSYILSLEESTPSGVLRTFDIDFTLFNASLESATTIFNQNGFIITSFKYVNHFREYIASELLQMIRNGNVEYYHTNLGFTIMNDGKKRFLLGKTAYNNSTSTYLDPNFQFQKGTMKDYLTFLDGLILPYFETRLALTLGLASVVSSYLMEHADVGTIVLNLYGQSSTGKTTIAQMMASLWGSPKVSNHGICRTFIATTNSLVHTFTGTNGVLIVIDDSTSQGAKDMTSFIYNVSAGEDKLRLGPNIELRNSKGSWSGLVAMTSETSILEYSSRTSGLVPRLLEFDNLVWTQDANHSKMIKREIMSNFGHLGPDFVSHFSKIKMKDLKDMFNACEDELDDLIKIRDQYSARIISKHAILYLTAKLIDEFYAFPQFSAEEIRDYLVAYETEKVPTRSVEAEALEIIKTFIIRNQNRLAFKSNKKQIMELADNREFIGYRTFIDENIVEITIISKVLSEELSKHNITQWANILRHLEKQEFVKKYGKDNKVSEKDNHLRVKAITFRFKRDGNEMVRWYYSKHGLTKDERDQVETSDFKVDDANEVDAIFDEE